ncbi:Aromatic-ring-hydroxylating dioxygenase alpha subunit [Penicillium cf. griseofulvum]|nr:Aromatic-ring-hydroxylating dioxygenase alpha subunit [Penicillium cf. griseofulvum]
MPFQTWLYISHSSQFHKPGSYQSFDVAGFPVFLIRGKDDKIRAFHNVCRHRAYTITKKETGASTILGCRYHGWSYNTTGRLVKAPHFDDVPGFDKSQNSLFEVHTHTTDQGLIFVNLDSGEPTAFDSELASTLRGFAHIAGLEAKSTWVTGQTLSGDFNWKIGGLFLALSFFPVSESKTNIRYDLFTRSTVSEPNIRQMSEALQSATKKLTEEIELEYQSMSARQGSSGEFNNTADTRQILSRLQEHTKLERIEGGQILPAMHKPEGSTLFQKADQLCKELDCVSGRSQNGTSLSAFDW